MTRQCMTLLALAGVVAAAACGGPRPQQGEVFPAAVLSGTWQRDGVPQVVPGADLYGRIDGGAEVFLELGFDHLLVQPYRRGDGVLEAELYRMRDPAAALGIYLAKCGDETPDPALAARHTVGPYQLQLVKGTSYLAINVLAGDGDMEPAMVALAQQIAANLDDGDTSGLFTGLPPADRVPGSERVIRGPYTLDAVYTLGEGDVLRLEGRATAVAAAYRDPGGGTWSEIDATYPDEPTAAAAFAHLAGNLDPYLTVLASSPRRLVFSDYAGRFGEVARHGAAMHIRVNLAEQPADDQGQ